MKKLTLLIALLLNGINIAAAESTTRTPQFSNDLVKVWKTVIYNKTNQALPMHRHENDRVVVALTDGLLKITNDKGKTHYLKLEKDKAYFLAKDPINELHNDENLSDHPISVMVIELKK